jgi:hypothetical protein
VHGMEELRMTDTAGHGLHAPLGPAAPAAACRLQLHRVLTQDLTQLQPRMCCTLSPWQVGHRQCFCSLQGMCSTPPGLLQPAVHPATNCDSWLVAGLLPMLRHCRLHPAFNW